VDRPKIPADSLSLVLIPAFGEGISESLAGRVDLSTSLGSNIEEVGGEHSSKLWLRGGFPKVFLAVDEAARMVWRDDFIRAFLERDIPQLVFRFHRDLRRFWTMVRSLHGQVWNAAQLARSLGTSENTARRYWTFFPVPI